MSGIYLANVEKLGINYELDPILGPPTAEVYAIDHPPDHPLISPIYADLTGLPPTLIQVGTRERLLSDSVRLTRPGPAGRW